MIDQKIKAEFILLRAQGFKYDEICEKLNVSKPTLIKWNKEFADSIKSAKVKLIEELVNKIYEDNKEYILIRLEALIRAHNPKPGLEKAALKVQKRAGKALGDCFRLKIASIDLKLTKDFDVRDIKIECF